LPDGKVVLSSQARINHSAFLLRDRLTRSRLARSHRGCIEIAF
jgi:hypothetical protein